MQLSSDLHQILADRGQRKPICDRLLRELFLTPISQRGMRDDLAMKFCGPTITASRFQ